MMNRKRSSWETKLGEMKMKLNFHLVRPMAWVDIIMVKRECGFLALGTAKGD